MIDTDKFLEPISPENPSGVYMGYSNEFDEIQQARLSDDPNLDLGEWTRPLKHADWGKVESLSEKLLLTKTKDLNLAGWLLEAWIHSNSFSGLASGLVLLNRLCQNFWDGLYPRYEDDETETVGARVAILGGILRIAGETIKTVPVTHSSVKGPCNLLDWEEVNRKANDLRRTPAEEKSTPKEHQPIGQFETECLGTSADFYKNNLSEIHHCQQALNELEATIDSLLEEDQFSVASLRTVLTEAEDFTRRFGKIPDDNAQDKDLPDATPNPGDTNMREENTAFSVKQQISSREEALRQLKIIAEFFRNTEPHSPVSYLADKAAHWGSMSLHDWLKATLKNKDSLSQLEEQLGVNEPGK